MKGHVKVTRNLKIFLKMCRHFCSMAPFRNHVDQWCHSNCNPDSVPELAGVNSQICEQLFKKINSHKNCRKMNESRFGLFFLYQYEIHNLEIENRTILADPREEVRWDNIKIVKVTLSTTSEQDKAVEKSTGPDIELVTDHGCGQEIDIE